MYIFLVIIIPLVYFVSEYPCRGRKIDREQGTCIFGGIVIACIYTLIHFFAFGTSRYWINTFSSVWTYYLLSEMALPVCVCLVAVLIGRDRISVKIRGIFPLMSAFFAIFIPYRVISDLGPDMFRMIFYPLLEAVMLFNIDTVVSMFEEGVDVRRLLWLRCLIAFFAIASGLLLPSLFMAYHFLNRMGALLYVLLALFVLSGAAFRVIAMLILPAKKKA